jgi:hypothetical protein
MISESECANGQLNVRDSLLFLQNAIFKYYTKIDLARQGTILPFVREITPIKRYNFRIKSGMCKMVYC